MEPLEKIRAVNTKPDVLDRLRQERGWIDGLERYSPTLEDVLTDAIAEIEKLRELNMLERD